MSRQRSIGYGLVGLLVLAIVAALTWPAPDPLSDAETVYLQMGRGDPQGGGSEAREGLQVVLDDRDLIVVGDRAAADVALELHDIRLNLGDVEISITDGRVRGRVSAECHVTDLRSGRRHVMDLTVTLDPDRIRASLRGRRFWEFWK
jgi:hypothetical protein